MLSFDILIKNERNAIYQLFDLFQIQNQLDNINYEILNNNIIRVFSRFFDGLMRNCYIGSAEKLKISIDLLIFSDKVQEINPINVKSIRTKYLLPICHYIPDQQFKMTSRNRLCFRAILVKSLNNVIKHIDESVLSSIFDKIILMILYNIVKLVYTI